MRWPGKVKKVTEKTSRLTPQGWCDFCYMMSRDELIQVGC